MQNLPTDAVQNPAYKFNPRYQEFVYDLAPGEVLDINADSDFVSCLGADADFKISFDNGPESIFKRGLKYTPGQTVRRVTLRNHGTAQNEIILGMGIGDITDARLTVPQDFLNALATPNTGFTKILSVPAATNNTPLAANNPDRRELIISNESAVKIFVKFQLDTPINTFAGVPVPAGAQVAFEHSGPVWGANLDNANAANLIYVTERGFNLTYFPPTGI